MNRAMNPYLHSMRYRALKHGSEEEYDMFEDFAICRARNRRMNGGADSRLQFELPPSQEDCNPTPETTQHTTRGDEHLAPGGSSCAEDGKRSQENDHTKFANTPPNTLNMTAEKEVTESNAPAGHGPHVDDHEESFQPDPSTSSNSAVLQITIQVESVQLKKNSGEPAACNDPLQAGSKTLE